MIDFDIFRRLFDSSFWRTLSESLVPCTPGEKPENKKQFLEQLFFDITNRHYTASVPRDYIVYNKHRYVTRIVPTFSYRDACVYFFCVKQLEDFIAVNRVPGTFGGWRLGNTIRKKEEEESAGIYVPTTSYNRFLWIKQWKDFQKHAYEYSLLGNFDYFLKFDIANFYDTINLHLLENKIRLVTPPDCRAVVDLLFSFLGSWNRKFEGYAQKTVGLPQDEIGDCSRILANFYLQDYDGVISQKCMDAGARYLRYSDDQMIFCNSESTANHILVEACKELFKINLSVNSGKVERFKNAEAFDEYWAFEIFTLLEERENVEKINRAAAKFFEWKYAKKVFNEWSALKRLIGIDFRLLIPETRFRLMSQIQSLEFLSSADHWVLQRIAQNSYDIEELYSLLDGLIYTTEFNGFHYNLLKFYKKKRPDYKSDKILARIEELRIR